MIIVLGTVVITGVVLPDMSLRLRFEVVERGDSSPIIVALCFSILEGVTEATGSL